MPRPLAVGSVVLALLAIAYQLHFKPILHYIGVFRQSKVGNVNVASDKSQKGWACRKVGMATEHDNGPEQGLLSACEKMVLHQPTGVLYLTCSTPSDRKHWTPTVGRLDADKHSEFTDYFATYDPLTDKITKMNINNFYGYSQRGFSVHGFDVVQSLYDPNELFIYAVNHRKPKPPADISAGADSVIELFKTKIGASSAYYLATFADPTIITPNDIVGNGDGLSFWFTNDHGTKVGWTRKIHADVLFGYSDTSIGYCHGKDGCKLAIENLHGANGIAGNVKNGTFYVGDVLWGGVTVLEKTENNDLIKVAKIDTEYPMDNLSLDSEGHLWLAALPTSLHFTMTHFADPTTLSPAAALKISMNTGPGAFYGEKFTVTKEFENNGTVASGTTTVVHDAQRNRLFLTGVVSSGLTVCDWQD